MDDLQAIRRRAQAQADRESQPLGSRDMPEQNPILAEFATAQAALDRAFRIWTGKRWRYFATLQAAINAAAAIHRETGIFVAIEESFV